MFAGAAGVVTTMLAIIVAFFPAKQITSLWRYEASMFGITLGFIALAVFFFYGYGRLKTSTADFSKSSVMPKSV
jgi:hypothetical protein